MVQVFAMKINRDLKKFEFDKLLRLVSKKKKKRVQSFYTYKDSQTCLIADIFTKKMICHKFNIDSEQIIFIEGINGKPKLNSTYYNINFNYSHSGDWIACVVSRVNVGIDVEEIKDIDMTIAKQFFTKVECEDIMKKEAGKQLSYFYDIWTLKESYIKWDGRGLSISLQDFSFRIKKNNTIEFKSNKEERHCYFKQYLIDSNYRLSVCASEDIFCSEVDIWKLDELLKIC